MNTVRRRSVLAAAGTALTAAPVLAACGSDDASGGEGAGGVIRLGYFGNITHAPALVGLQAGVFEDALPSEVTIETEVFNAGPSAIEALFSGAIDISYIGPNPAINGWAQSGGQALHIVAGSTSGGAGLVVGEGITSARDLEGKSVATPQLGNTQDVAARYWLREQGYETDENGGGDVSVVPIDNSEVAAAFDGGTVQAAWAVEPRYSELVLDHGAHIFQDERELWEGGEFVTVHIIVATEFLENNPELVKAFITGHLAAIDYITDSPEEAQTAVNDHLEALSGNRLTDEVVASAFTTLSFTADPIAASLKGSADHATEVGLLDEVDLTGIYRLDLLNEALTERGDAAVSAGDLA
ncbi:aliphatic sulfonate ABC transporter substrate-binding protein [Glycomyces buryatensis]|uniref:Aliphatic sulfonate ABC transporter substrate-binding protein n=1 Tax=Glycomyces buryatensis TaxID=2570927 RepID=A0A4S8PQY2_9ACTN|nr:aliphatic sulfonate ABC transporter substrate-binding protein [Glycomyces buryatensis]THV33557.1 aliphatic sulfonate ABC transporter substrate-binding protein [Glycomyces buryatensis]